MAEQRRGHAHIGRVVERNGGRGAVAEEMEVDRPAEGAFGPAADAIGDLKFGQRRQDVMGAE